LVLDTGDGTLGSPVDSISEVGGIEWLGIRLLVGSLESKKSLVFSLGPVRELVESDG
jgi:hypothetical protein